MRIIVMGIGLLLSSYWDIRKREIPAVFVIWFGLIGIVLYFLEEQWLPIQILLAVIPGLLLLGIGKITHEAVGYGDGILILVMGIYLEIGKTMEVCFIAFFLAAICSIILLLLKKADKASSIPFIPFLFAGYVGGVLNWYR